jgi:hypothetical protein
MHPSHGLQAMNNLKTWLLWCSIGFGVLFLNAALERPETDELTAQVVNDAAPAAASQETASVAMKE